LKANGKNGPPHSISLRLARQADARQLESLFLLWLGFPKKGRLEEIRKAIKEKEIVVATTAKVADSSKRDGVVGFVHGILHNDPISAGPLLYITSLFVKNAFRRQRIGSSMLSFIVDRSVRNRSIQSVEVATVSKKALKFYKRLGFRQFKGDFGEVLVQLDTEQWRPLSLNGPLNSRFKGMIGNSTIRA